MTTTNEFRNQILTKASEDDDFRSQLLSDPRATIGSELNVDIPENMTLNVVEDSATTVNLVLPPKVQLDEAGLESVSAGGGPEIDFGW